MQRLYKLWFICLLLYLVIVGSGIGLMFLIARFTGDYYAWIIFVSVIIALLTSAVMKFHALDWVFALKPQGFWERASYRNFFIVMIAEFALPLFIVLMVIRG